MPTVDEPPEAKGVCWCTTEDRCPHAISARLPAMLSDIEKVIDDVLIQFDRKDVKHYLKRNIEGKPKSTLELTGMVYIDVSVQHVSPAV